MVSLQPNNMSTGAQYMDAVMGDSGAASGSDVEPILASTDNGNFKKLRTIPVVSIHLLISTVISFVGISLTYLWPENKHNEACFIMTSLRVAFWAITFLFDQLIRKHHNELRMNGYHDFHRSITRHNGVALNVVSAWNTLLLLALAESLYTNITMNTWITPVSCILAFQIFETSALLTAHGVYIYTVNKFNKNALHPDALRGTNSSAGSLGLMQPGGNVAELLEKQVYKPNNMNTSKGIVYDNSLRGINEDAIRMELKSQNVCAVEKILKRVGEKLVESGLIILTFATLKRPDDVHIGHKIRQVRDYVPLPFKCNNCHRFGHLSKYCKHSKICYNCGKSSHSDGQSIQCDRTPCCINCKSQQRTETNHPATSNKCPIFLKHKEIQIIKVANKVDYKTAYNMYKERVGEKIFINSVVSKTFNDPTTSQIKTLRQRKRKRRAADSCYFYSDL